jgi:hypothetical protein
MMFLKCFRQLAGINNAKSAMKNVVNGELYPGAC